MPSAHFDDFDPEVVEPEPPTEEGQRALARLASDELPEEPPATQ